MRTSAFIALIIVSLADLSYADEAADIQAFNEAFSAYKVAMQQSRTDLQIDAALDTLAAGRKLFDPSDLRLPILMANYGIALFNANQQEESKEVLEEALELAEQIHGKKAPELVHYLAALADAESELYSASRQLKYYKRALKIVAEANGKDSDEYANLAYRAGRSVYQLSQSSSGRKYLLEAYELFLSRKGETALETGLATYQLGRLEYSRSKYAKSAEYVLAALPAFEAQEDPDFQLLAHALLVQAYEERGKTDLATEHCVAIGRLSKLRPNQDYQPLFRLAPEYPRELLISGVEGFVDFEFTIDKNGFVRDPEVLDLVSTGRPGNSIGRSSFGSRPEDRSFESAALKALERFRYAPRFVDGNAIEVDKVKTRISFAIED